MGKEPYIEDQRFSSVKKQKLYLACRGPQPISDVPFANLFDWGYWRSAYAKELYDNKYNPEYAERIEEFMKEYGHDLRWRQEETKDG